MEEGKLTGESWTDLATGGMFGSSPPLIQQSGVSPGRDGRGVYQYPSQGQLSSISFSGMSESASLLRLQNLRRLYGSLEQLNYGSRSSLPEIQEDKEADTGIDFMFGQENNEPMGINDRITSEEDLFNFEGATSAMGGRGGDVKPVLQTPAPTSRDVVAPSSTESRCLFIRNIDPSVSEESLREYFECFGDIHSLYTGSKNRGYVMVTYHDIRAARLAQHTVHGQEWRGRQLVCQFSQDSQIDANRGGAASMGTVYLLSLDGGRSLEDIYYLLSSYGELRDLHKDSTKPNCCIAEFYDVRHALAASAGIMSSPELRSRLVVVIDESLKSRLATSAATAGATHALPNLNNNGKLSALEGSSSMPALTSSMFAGVKAQDLAAINRNMSEMSLESLQAPLGSLEFPPNEGHGTLSQPSMNQLNTNSAQSRSGSAYPLGAMTGSSGSLGLWTSQMTGQGNNNISLSSSPTASSGAWLAASNATDAVYTLQQQAAILQQQQQQQQQASAIQALQQALLTQQQMASAFGLHANTPLPSGAGGGGISRRGFSEPSLGGRLARRPMDPVAEAERRAQQERLYGLDMARIAAGQDRRTTLMIKNIPNKYTQKMLLALLEERFARTRPFPFDFFYLPIDFKNRCNVGYAFINMTSPSAIPALVEEFHGKRWPKFNSEKVCAIAYARIQGKTALVQHFQNSSLLHEDKRCRPLLFGRDGEVEIFPIITTNSSSAEVGLSGPFGAITTTMPPSL